MADSAATAPPMTDAFQGVYASLPHDSAARHVAGSAVYIDDLPEPAGMLHVHFGLSTRAHARITAMDLSAVRVAPGVVLVLTAADIPGENDVSPVIHDDKLFATDTVTYVGQSLFAVAATSIAAARAAAAKAVIAYASRDLPPAIFDSMRGYCIFGTVARNETTAPLSYRVADWRFVTPDGKKHKLRTKSEWIAVWTKLGADFSYSILPDDMTFEEGDWAQGFTTLKLPSGARFDLIYTWRQHGKTYTGTMRNLACPIPR